MTPRMLDRSEWATKLVGTELEGAVKYLPPHAYVLVIEDDGVIVGCWAALQIWHVEGLWIHPAHRMVGTVGRRLLIAMLRLLDTVCARRVMTAALSPEIRELILKFGGEQLPGEHFVLPIGGA